MININNLKSLLHRIGFIESNGIFTKQYPNFNYAEIKVDFKNQKIKYPESHGLKVWDETSSGNFSHPENFVVLECITRLLDKGYRPEHIQLEKRWKVGHGASGGKGDICVSNECGDQMLMIIECKTAGKEYNEELKKIRFNGGQLFSYFQQERSTQWLVLYCSDFIGEDVIFENTIIKTHDDANILKMAEKDKSQQTYLKANTVEELYEVWNETYQRATYDNLIFGIDSSAYKIGVKPLKKQDLRDFTPNDKIFNRFEEILRHNNVSDKENAFNRLVALFICKLVDEIKKNDLDEVEFQYKVGTDTYESLQDRLQRLHKIGMEEFMQEKINYVDDDYAERLFKNLSPIKREKAIEELRNTIKILKYYTNNDFTFKDVHNEELFYQNGKILVEVVQLFEKYRIVYSAKHQFLGDLFEQLLNRGFKQNEGQFFTPTPITRFIWDCLPLEKIIRQPNGYKLPKVIDYACGAGHFLTEGVEAINNYFKSNNYLQLVSDNKWVEEHIFGIEKDYRLARVAKVCLHMNGAGKGRIIFGDGLEQYIEKGIENGTFDILVANPPYSVEAFKSHLKLKNNDFEILQIITNTGSEIETLFVERTSQLLKPQGIAAVVLPRSILSKDNGSNITARELILKNFYLRAITEFGSKTFGETPTDTVVLFLEKYNEPPKRKEQLKDSVQAILSNQISSEWEDKLIFEEYLKRINVQEDDYKLFLSKQLSFEQLLKIEYFKGYVTAFKNSPHLRDLKKKKYYKELTTEEQQKLELESYYKQQFDSEKEKIYYFGFIYQQNVLIVSSPSDTDKQKDFLGYGWSKRKGNEGIQINNPGGLLYNNEDRYATNTLASAIRLSFNEIQKIIPELEEFYTYARFQDMIEFGRPTFNKTIKTSVDKKNIVRSKYPLERLEQLLTPIKGNQTKIPKEEIKENGNIPVITQDSASLIAGYTDCNKPIKDIPLIVFGDHNCSYKYIDFEFVRGADGTQLIKTNTKVNLKYLYNYLLTIELENQGKYERHYKYLKETMIPVPPTEIQEKIINKCQEIEEIYNTTRMEIEDYKNKIQQIFETLQVIDGGGGKILRLSDKDIFEISIGRRVLASEVNPKYEIPVYSANVFEPFGMINKSLLNEFSNDSVVWGIDGDWMVNVIPANNPFYPTDHCGVIRIKTHDILPKYFAFLLEKEGQRAGFKRSYRASIDRIEGLSITSAPIEAQKEAIRKVEEYEVKIKKAQELMQKCINRKKDIINSYLM